ncbi:hypothetical protein [Bradyrhizobium sp.]|jgi:hypothetical protein|uniref:hypothetical protein n=1 Tax=Bradyrhizobium sp. TaxID=376 RepID=UPI002E025AED|nr:hypothetical protein [Bradyrhizobium sp.]
MNWAWPTSLDQLWRSPTFPMWLTLAAGSFFALVLLITLLRAEKSVANGALTVITLLAIGVAVAATIRGFGPGGATASRGAQSSQPMTAALPALSCVDDLAGEVVLAACEKVLFGSADAAAAAVSYAAARLSQLTSFGDVASANNNMTPELSTLRRSVERDRYGLMAYVLAARDRCQPAECAAYRSLTDHNQIAANMDERIYESLILRHSSSWNAPVTPAAPAAGAVAALPPSLPTGKPTNAEFPSAASTPPVNIMTPEPPLGSTAAAPRPSPAAANAPTPAPRPSPASTAAKKQAAPKARAAAPVQLSPAPGAPAGAADND